jgi:hypothetical protein
MSDDMKGNAWWNVALRYCGTFLVTLVFIVLTLGWFVASPKGERLIWHTGLWEGAYSALYLKAPDRGLTLILLANSDGLRWESRLDEAAIERSLARRHLVPGGLVMLDVTSTWMEGRCCPLAARGYSREEYLLLSSSEFEQQCFHHVRFWWAVLALTTGDNKTRLAALKAQLPSTTDTARERSTWTAIRLNSCTENYVIIASHVTTRICAITNATALVSEIR